MEDKMGFMKKLPWIMFLLIGSLLGTMVYDLDDRGLIDVQLAIENLQWEEELDRLVFWNEEGKDEEISDEVIKIEETQETDDLKLQEEYKLQKVTEKEFDPVEKFKDEGITVPSADQEQGATSEYSESEEEKPKEVQNIYLAPNGKTYRYKKVINMESTAYTDSIQDTGKAPGHPAFGITYTGMKTRVGVVAVDPKVIPLKSKLYVEGYGEAIAADIGGAIKENRIDLYFNTRKEALEYGRKYDIKVYLLE